MVQATFTLPLSEFDSTIVDKIKMLLNGGDSEGAEVFIRIRPKKVRSKKPSALREETREQYFTRLQKSVEETRSGTGLMTFKSIEELEDFAQQPQPSHAENPG